MIKFEKKIKKTLIEKTTSENLIVLFKITRYAFEDIVFARRLKSEDIKL